MKKLVNLVKRGRGRPKGSKNKVKAERADGADNVKVKKVKIIKEKVSKNYKEVKSNKEIKDKKFKKVGKVSKIDEKVVKGFEGVKDVKVPKKRGRKRKELTDLVDKKAEEDAKVEVSYFKSDKRGTFRVNDDKVEEVKDRKVLKLLGYCPKCNQMVTNEDMVSAKIFICIGCKLRSRINRLNESSCKLGEAKSIKDFKNDVIEANHIDTVPLNDHIDLS